MLSLLLIFTYTQVYGTNYVIKVSTSRVAFAGTDARVYVNLIGVNGDSTGSIRLHNSIWDFEFGRTDTFHGNAKFVGHLKEIKVYHDGWGIFPNWHLAQVTVSFSGSPLYTFYFHKWIPPWKWITAYEQNECRAGVALCQHVCIDTSSSYNCACHKGYKLEGRYKCRDVDECMTGAHKCEQESTACNNTPGGYTCQCKNGYQPAQSLFKCQDINECDYGEHKCDNQTTTCSNKLGTYNCQCKNGYQPDQSLYKCQDVNECVNGKHKCELESTICNNSLGSYTCQCKEGYEPIHQSVYKCEAKQCNASIPLGMQDGRISNQSITASSHYFNYPPWGGRLNAGIAKSWYAVAEDTDPWIQVDLGKVTWLKGVATQGKMFSLFVKTYKLAYSSDEVTWFNYREPDAKVDKIFKGNTGPYNTAEVELVKPVYTRYVRLYPQSWEDGVALKLELFGCRPE